MSKFPSASNGSFLISPSLFKKDKRLTDFSMMLSLYSRFLLLLYSMGTLYFVKSTI